MGPNPNGENQYVGKVDWGDQSEVTPSPAVT